MKIDRKKSWFYLLKVSFPEHFLLCTKGTSNYPWFFLWGPGPDPSSSFRNGFGCNGVHRQKCKEKPCIPFWGWTPCLFHSKTIVKIARLQSFNFILQFSCLKYGLSGLWKQNLQNFIVYCNYQLHTFIVLVGCISNVKVWKKESWPSKAEKYHNLNMQSKFFFPTLW